MKFYCLSVSIIEGVVAIFIFVSISIVVCLLNYNTLAEIYDVVTQRTAYKILSVIA